MSHKSYLTVQTIMKQEGLFKTNTDCSIANIEAILQYEFRDPELDIDTFFTNYASGKYTKYLQGRKERAKFYSSAAWRKLKAVALKIYGARCMKCSSVKSIQVDHMVSRTKDPSKSLDINNLGILCEACNLKKSYNSEDYRSEEDKAKLEAALKQ